jgi:hypothetical protein
MFMLISQHPGGDAHSWRPLDGEPNVAYRWSQPDSNTCLVEFTSQDHTGPRSFETVAKIYTTRPQAPVKTKSISAIKPQATRIIPQVSERRVSVQLFRLGNDAQRLSNCYGVVQVNASGGGSHPGVPAESRSDTGPK